jgi:hypothetical protein
MAESARKCVQCGYAVRMFSGVTIGGVPYHTGCWGGLFKPVSPERTGSIDREQPDVPRVMPAVGPLQLGNRRAA